MTIFSTVSATVLTTLFVGCTVVEVEPGYESGGIGPIEAQARNNCVGQLRDTTGRAIAIVSSTYSAVGTEVVMRALPDEDWRCVAGSDGGVITLEMT